MMVDDRTRNDVVSAEEWTVIHALRRFTRSGADVSAHASQDDLEVAYRRLESEILDNVGSTLDRMIDRADRTSADLDDLLRRLIDTTGSQRPAA